MHEEQVGGKTIKVDTTHLQKEFWIYSSDLMEKISIFVLSGLELQKWSLEIVIELLFPF